MTTPDQQALERARALVQAAQRVVVLTGAGISTDSGIPDFRGPNGVWTRNPGAEKLATLSHYMSSSEVRVQAWRRRIESRPWERQPNSGHGALLSLEKTGQLDTLITQNIDGLHQKAGSDPAKVVEIHGTVLEFVCMKCGDRGPMMDVVQRVEGGEADPPCLSCGGILKSATISFGQSLVAEDLLRAERAARRCDLLLAIGSTLSVFPIAGVVPTAKDAGASVVIVNGDATEMDELADVVLRGSITPLLTELLGAS
ncbi:MAG: hypothetical protein OXU20_40185 [Myxococcales bacterium]|nr:hypothetical protein [Myxococcales bacterium]MDD9966001.1 hypothetical protein [Myxococcales bacterium]